MTYNKLNKVFCDCCNKSVNRKYFKKHCEQKRHLRLKAEQEAKNGITVNNMVRDIKDIIEKYGLNNVKEICDMMTEKVEEPVNEIVDIGKDCWDIINGYKADLELDEKYIKLMDELKHTYKSRYVSYEYRHCCGEEDWNNGNEYIYNKEDCNDFISYRVFEENNIRRVDIIWEIEEMKGGYEITKEGIEL